MDTIDLPDAWKSYLKDKDSKAKQKLLEYYYNTLVKKIAKGLTKKFKGKIGPDELASYGVDGLYSSLDAFDPSKGVKFETYAYTRIWGSMIDGIREEDWVPRSVRKKQTIIENTKNSMESFLGHKIDETEIVCEAGFDIKEFYKNKHNFFASSVSSIESTPNTGIDQEDNNKDCNKYLVASDDTNPDILVDKNEFWSKLLGRDFCDRERQIIYFCYREGLTISCISKKMGMSESRISQIHKKALKKIKNRIELNPKFFSKYGNDIMFNIKE